MSEVPPEKLPRIERTATHGEKPFEERVAERLHVERQRLSNALALEAKKKLAVRGVGPKERARAEGLLLAADIIRRVKVRAM